MAPRKITVKHSRNAQPHSQSAIKRKRKKEGKREREEEERRFRARNQQAPTFQVHRFVSLIYNRQRQPAYPRWLSAYSEISVKVSREMLPRSPHMLPPFLSFCPALTSEIPEDVEWNPRAAYFPPT